LDEKVSVQYRFLCFPVAITHPSTPFVQIGFHIGLFGLGKIRKSRPLPQFVVVDGVKKRLGKKGSREERRCVQKPLRDDRFQREAFPYRIALFLEGNNK
jgi:hypothetical protein